MELVLNPDKAALTEERLLQLIPDHDAVLASSEKYTQRVLSSAPRLRVIARTGVGYDAIDVDFATKQGIYVTWTPIPELAYAMAEHTINLTLSVLKKTCNLNVAVRSGTWDRGRWLQESDDLYYLTFGLLGAGRIGREVAKRVKAFGAKVIYHDIVRSKELEEGMEVEYVSFDQLLARADVLSIHTPLTPQTRGIINAGTIGKMKMAAIIINTARGEIIDERALADALEQGKIRGAGLDALTQEPPREGHIFYRLSEKLPTLIITPHVGFGMHTFDLMVRAAAEDVARVLSGEVPKYSINANAIRR